MMRRWGLQSTSLFSVSLCTGLALAGIFMPRPVVAQTIYLEEGGPDFGPGGFDAVLPSDVVASVRSTGLRPVSRPVLRGRRYVLHAIDTDGVPVRVVVNARTGRVMNVRAVGPEGGAPRWADRHAAPAGAPPRAARSYIDPETGERVYENRVYREGERDDGAPQNAPGSHGPHVITGTQDHPTAKSSASKKAETVKLPPRKTAARAPDKAVAKDARPDADSAKTSAPRQPADTAHSVAPVKQETAKKSPEPNVTESNASTASSVEAKQKAKPSDHEVSQAKPDAKESSTATHTEAAGNAGKAADSDAAGGKAADAKPAETKPADGKSAAQVDHAKIDREAAERVNAEMIAKAKAEAKAQAASAGAGNSKSKRGHETDGSGAASPAKAGGFPPVQDLE